MSQTSFYGHGKLLLTGEYLVLAGADALAVPLRLGQHVRIKNMRGADLQWKSLKPDGTTWFKGTFSLLDFSAQETTDPEIADRITKLLNGIARQNPDFLSDWKGKNIETELEFEPEWGLGSSATLLHCMAEWGKAEPYTLLDRTFGGSGYDVACASADGPIVYRSNDEEIRITPTDLPWTFRDNLLFVWSGKKQSSRDAVASVQSRLAKAGSMVKTISDLTNRIAKETTLDGFIDLMSEHNHRLSEWLDKKPEPAIAGFPGLIKPLGAWGGDFFLAASNIGSEEMRKQFKSLGYNVMFGWKEFVIES